MPAIKENNCFIFIHNVIRGSSVYRNMYQLPLLGQYLASTVTCTSFRCLGNKDAVEEKTLFGPCWKMCVCEMDLRAERAAAKERRAEKVAVVATARRSPQA